jgi:ribose transport system ATP-binding protein
VPASEVVLRMRGVRKRFAALTALDGVDLEVRRGEVHALLGENGAGKSTLMKVLSGALQPDAGEMELEGRPFAPSGPLAALHGGVAMIYQELNLAPHLTVEENVLLGRERRRLGLHDRRGARPRVEAALAALGAVGFGPRTLVAHLGPGERQMVEIARALCADARVVVLDEPTSSLSRGDTDRLFEAVARLAASGAAVVYISHFLEEVQRVAQRYTVLRDGRTVGSGEVQGTSVERLVELMAGRRLAELYPRAAREPGEVVLELRELAGVRLPRSASLALRRGEILGLFGLVGAGRTELLRALFALDPVRRGEVRVAGIAAPARSPRERLRQGLGLLSEDRKEEGLAVSMSLAENVTLSRLAPFARCGWIRRGSQASAAQRWIERLAIRCRSPRQRVQELSGGNQQKVALARLLQHDVDVLLLDEPTRGIDVGAKAEIYRLMGELAAAGKALLVASSHLPELLGVCDRIAVMHRGVLGAAVPASERDEHALLDEAARGRP